MADAVSNPVADVEEPNSPPPVAGGRTMEEEMAGLVQMKERYNKHALYAVLAVGGLLILVIVSLQGNEKERDEISQQQAAEQADMQSAFQLSRPYSLTQWLPKLRNVVCSPGQRSTGNPSRTGTSKRTGAAKSTPSTFTTARHFSSSRGRAWHLSRLLFRR